MTDMLYNTVPYSCKTSLNPDCQDSFKQATIQTFKHRGYNNCKAILTGWETWYCVFAHLSYLFLKYVSFWNYIIMSRIQKVIKQS